MVLRLLRVSFHVCSAVTSGDAVRAKDSNALLVQATIVVAVSATCGAFVFDECSAATVWTSSFRGCNAEIENAGAISIRSASRVDIAAVPVRPTLRRTQAGTLHVERVNSIALCRQLRARICCGQGAAPGVAWDIYE